MAAWLLGCSMHALHMHFACRTAIHTCPYQRARFNPCYPSLLCSEIVDDGPTAGPGPRLVFNKSNLKAYLGQFAANPDLWPNDCSALASLGALNNHHSRSARTASATACCTTVPLLARQPRLMHLDLHAGGSDARHGTVPILAVVPGADASTPRVFGALVGIDSEQQAAGAPVWAEVPA